MTDLSKQSVLIQIGFDDLFKSIWAELFTNSKARHLDVKGLKHRSIISEATLRVSDTLVIMTSWLFIHPKAMMGQPICLGRDVSQSITPVLRPWELWMNQRQPLGWRGLNAEIHTQAESCSKHSAICTS